MNVISNRKPRCCWHAQASHTVQYVYASLSLFLWSIYCLVLNVTVWKTFTAHFLFFELPRGSEKQKTQCSHCHGSTKQDFISAQNPHLTIHQQFEEIANSKQYMLGSKKKTVCSYTHLQRAVKQTYSQLLFVEGWSTSEGQFLILLE